MTPAEIRIVTKKRSESWLRNHECAWCGKTLWQALRYGCIDCDPAEKDFSDAAKVKTT